LHVIHIEFYIDSDTMRPLSS